MNLQIRDRRAHDLARRLAERDNTTMTEAVITALQNELGREPPQDASLAFRFEELAQRLRSMSPGGGRVMTKDEIDQMWGHD